MKPVILIFSSVFVLSLFSACQGREAEKTLQQVDSNAIPVVKHRWYGFDLLDILRGIEGKISVDVSATVQSKNMWYGFDLYDDHGVFIPAAGITLGNTGFSGKIIGGYCLSGGFVDSQVRHYALFYTGSFLEDTRYVTNFTTNYIYYGMPKIHGTKSDTQEVGVSLAWPKLLGDNGLLPNYYVGRLWPTRSHSNFEGSEGSIHILGLAYDFIVPDFWAIGKNQGFRLSGDVTYNDGFGTGAAKHDWSHAVFGASTNLGNGNITITPFVNYQISMDDSVNKEDEAWCGVNFTYRF
jgi:hypothetical protein